MRIYSTFPQALNEIRRDLGEMGITVLPKTYQNKDIAGNSDYATKELQNYVYVVTQPRLEDLTPTQPWADLELADRLSGEPLNPGNAYQTRPEVWNQFLNEDGTFCYSYPERLNLPAVNAEGNDYIVNQVQAVIDHIRKDPDSRQLFISVWDPYDIEKIGGISRVPCTLGYQILVRGGQINLTYFMRSSDFATHFVNDIYLAHALQRHIAEQTGYKVGNFTHFAGSLHIYAKDVKDVF